MARARGTQGQAGPCAAGEDHPARLPHQHREPPRARARAQAGRAAHGERPRPLRQPEAARRLCSFHGQPHPGNPALGAVDRRQAGRLTRNVALYGGGVGEAPPPVDRFSDRELAAILDAACTEQHFPILLLLARSGLRIGEACGLRWRDVQLGSTPPRLTVVWQFDKWGDIVDPKSPSARRTIPLREEVRRVLMAWRERQERWADRLGDAWHHEHGLVFTTRTGRPVPKRNVARSFERVRQRAGVDHGTLKTLRSTVATQLAEAGLHPRKAQAFLGHAQMSTTMKYYTAVSDVDDAADLLPDLDE